MHIRTLALICLGLLGLVAIPESAPKAAVPQLINYQGKLTGPEGKPPATGDYTLSFSIYDNPVGQSCTSAQMQFPTLYDCARLVWGPQVFDGKSDMVGHGAKVPVVKGFFNVLLGPYDIDGDPIARAFTESNRFVEVTVGDDGPVLPRQQVLSAPYALKSVGDVPVGGITMFFGEEEALPENWEICDGRSVDDLDSPLHGRSLPDLRGMFVRGAINHRQVGNIAGRDKRDTHRHDVSVRAHISKHSLNGWMRRDLLCIDGDEHSGPSCDGTQNLHFGTWSKMRINVYPSVSALVMSDDDTTNSHGHDVKVVTNRVSWDKRTNLDNRPRHIHLHYIIRIK